MVDRLKSIPELNGVSINGYDEYFPDRNDVAMAIWKMKPPALLCIWRGTMPASMGTMEVWKHNYSIAIRADDQLDGKYSYFALWSAIANGRVNGDGECFRCCPL